MKKLRPRLAHSVDNSVERRWGQDLCLVLTVTVLMLCSWRVRR